MARVVACYLCLILAMADGPMARRLDKHSLQNPSPAEAPQSEETAGLPSREASAAGEDAAAVAVQDQAVKIDHHHHHRSVDKSVAGGGVILGGLATVFLVAVFCYIRATGRRTAEPASPTNSDSPIGRKNGEPSVSLDESSN